MNSVRFELGESSVSTRLVAYNMLTNWHEGGRMDRDLYRKRDTISAKCADDLGDNAEDTAVWNGRIASWLREYVNAE